VESPTGSPNAYPEVRRVMLEGRCEKKFTDMETGEFLLKA
jgi:hypothetical protein